MKINEKISYLKSEHFLMWNRYRRIVFAQMSASQSIRCVCGKLATGLHEDYCKKLKDKADRETVKLLFPKIEK